MSGDRPGLRVAILDYYVEPTNAIGNCHRMVLERLSHDHRFTVFSLSFDNPDPERIDWVRIRVPGRPLALLFVAFHLVAPLYYLAYRVRHRVRFDLVQVVEANTSFGDVSYSQFCHRSYLRLEGNRMALSGPRGLGRWVVHRLAAALEPRVHGRMKAIVVPSTGLSDDLAVEYPASAGKVTVIPNPVRLERLTPPPGFDRRAERLRLGIGQEDIAATFVALGHFERKGLPLLLDAMARLGHPGLRLVVVGGQPDLVRAYSRRAADQGLAGVIRFVGMQGDVRPFLWASDFFAQPSSYETFSFATWEAAGAGLPLLVTEHHGTRDVVVDGENGVLVGREVTEVLAGLRKITSLTPEQRRQMGERARDSARRYDLEAFLQEWSRLYERLAVEP